MLKAKGGCTESMWEIKSYFWKDISELSERYASLIVSQSSFENNCYSRIELAVRKFEPSRGSFIRYVRFWFFELAKVHIVRGKNRRRMLSLDALSEEDTGYEGSSRRYELQDDLAIIDADFLANEKVASLAGDDIRKLSILNAWKDGYFNDSETASFLAERHGGNTESHRKFITRFRTHCQQTLSKAN
jgi:hypothetical protein